MIDPSKMTTDELYRELVTSAPMDDYLNRASARIATGWRIIYSTLLGAFVVWHPINQEVTYTDNWRSFLTADRARDYYLARCRAAGAPYAALRADVKATPSSLRARLDAISERAGTPYVCEACLRPEVECSANPCADVLADRSA